MTSSQPPQPPAGGQPPEHGQQPPPGYGAPGYGTQPPLSDSDQRMWALIAHLGPLLVGFIAPLVVWLVFKERGRFVEEQAKESLNFQITITILGIAIGIISVITLGLGSFLYLVFIVALVFMIMAAIAVNKGEAYRYPVNIRMIK